MLQRRIWCKLQKTLFPCQHFDPAPENSLLDKISCSLSALLFDLSQLVIGLWLINGRKKTSVTKVTERHSYGMAYRHFNMSQDSDLYQRVYDSWNMHSANTFCDPKVVQVLYNQQRPLWISVSPAVFSGFWLALQMMLTFGLLREHNCSAGCVSLFTQTDLQTWCQTLPSWQQLV